MISRRRVLSTGFRAGLSTLVVPPLIGRAWAAQPLIRTPSQPAGPFYPAVLPAEHDADLAKVADAANAIGQIVQLDGTVRGLDGAPISGARVEIWQCDAVGVYHHVGDGAEDAADPGFQGYGQAETDQAGAYRFRTIHPVPYPGRTPHIHVMVSGPGVRRLVTQLYVAGLASNARDFLFSRLDAAAQARLLVDFQPAPEVEPGALAGRFDLVVERSAG